MADSILRLKVESQEYDNKLKRAAEGIRNYADGCRRVSGTLEVVEKDTLEFTKSLGQMDTVARSAKGKISELGNAYNELSIQYKRMTDEEKKSPFGQALSASLDQLKVRFNDSKKELADIDKKLNGATQATGDFSGVLGQLGSKLGINADLMGLVTTGTMGYVAAAGAAITATIAATKAWADYNEELSKQMQITTVTTGLSGGDANKLRDAADAMAKVYGVDFREVINAANILMTQFGQTSDRSIQLLRDGMQGMIAGDGPKMLNMIQQFAPAFRDAGISADQLVAIIHNSEGGLFSEQNMNAILRGIENIRLMTKSTSDALAQLGLDGEEMSKRMSEGSMTVFEALEQVAVAIEGAKSGSQEAGQVMQQVFGRHGAKQGMELGRAIAELNTNLEQTKEQTGELGKSFAALETANERLNESIRNATGWDEMEQKIKNVEAEFVSAVAMAVGAIGDVRNALYDLSGIDVFDRLVSQVLLILGPVGTLLEGLRQIAGLNITPPDNRPKYNRDNFQNPLAGKLGQVTPQTSTYEDRPKPTTTPPPPKTPKTPKTPKIDTDKEVTLQQQIAALEKEAFTASEERRNEIAATIQELDKELARQKEIRDALHGIVKESKELQAAEKQYADAVARVQSWQKPNSAGIGNYISDVQKSLSTQTFGSEGYDKLAQNLVDAQTFKNLMQTALQNGLSDIAIDAAPMWEQIIKAEDIPNEKWQEIVDKINEFMKDHPIELDFKTGSVKNQQQKTEKEKAPETTVVKSMSAMAGSINLIAGGIQQLGVDMPEGLSKVLGSMQGITTILTGISALVSAIEFITAADAAIPFFAQGGVVHAAGGFSGIVPGNRLSGDQVPALLNSGETVLTRAQAANIDTMLQDAGQRGATAQPYVEGEKIFLGMNNYLRRSGRGELITSKR